MLILLITLFVVALFYIAIAFYQMYLLNDMIKKKAIRGTEVFHFLLPLKKGSYLINKHANTEEQTLTLKKVIGLRKINTVLYITAIFIWLYIVL